MQTRISATINQNLKEFAQDFAQKSNKSLSNVLEMGLILLKEQIKTEQLKKGYKAMSQDKNREKEASEWTANLISTNETW